MPTKKIFMFFIIIFSSSCVSETDLTEKKIYDLVNYYLTVEKNKDWSSLYDLRTPEFKKSTSKPYFINLNQDEDKDWDLLSWEITGYKRLNESIVVVRIDSISSPSTSYRDKTGYKSDTVKLRDLMYWVKYQDKWFCREAPYREHLSLNIAVEPLSLDPAALK